MKHKDWLAKIDLKDAFFTIPIYHNQKSYLRFEFQNKTYQFNSLPFGLSVALWVFTKTLRPAIALLRQLGVRLIVYIDDMLILAESSELLAFQIEAIIDLLECLGFVINQKISVTTPTQTVDFLGLTIDSIQMELKLPSEKMKKIRVESRKLAQEGTRSLARLLERMNATSSVIPPAPLFCRHLQMNLSQALEDNSQDYNSIITLSHNSREELMWWDSHMGNWNGRSLMKQDITLTIDSDASLTGWGAACLGRWPLVSTRTNTPKLRGVTSSNTGCPDLFEEQIKYSILHIKDRQHHSSCLHKQLELVTLARDLWM